MNIPTAALVPEGASKALHGGVDDSALSAERPFPGLRPFGFADRAFFFGRERQAFALYRLIEHARFIAVVGSSGSGKSSLVLAGLRKLLEEESGDPGGPNWVCIQMRPGGSPLARLATALGHLADKDTPDEAARRREAVEYSLHQSSFSFESALGEAGGLGGRTLLLIVDQFEELFRFGLAGLGARRASVSDTRARDEATQFVQILLDADRRRLKDVRVLITMRSDFIGDCAHFHGLPEAVSATQYLVPNLTRSQLEEVICKPIEEAGAAIEPELVERLLNDSGDELDQLPALQHCLMRLWDRAGVASAERLRRLTRQTYDDVGRMAEALSRHADEILRSCAGKELVAEQAFRALSEVDREGRAIRRALPFGQLLAETGVGEVHLRAVLDKFRAPNCSFLVPPPSNALVFCPEDRVDIGHETLLRRWKKLAGESQKVDAATGRPPEGWLAKEQADGQRYRTLASLLEGGASGEMAELNDPKREKRWWDGLPRTEAWADRYGGKFESVKKLIVDSIAADKRESRNRWITRAAAVSLVLLAGGAIAYSQWQIQVREEQAKQAQIEQEEKAKREKQTREEDNEIDRQRQQANAASQLLRDFLDTYHKGQLTERAALSLMPLIDNFTAKVRDKFTPPEAGKLWIQTLNVKAELLMSSDDPDAAPKMARTADQTAQSFAEGYPDNADTLQLRFESLIRTGDAFLSQPGRNGSLDLSLDEYRHALIIAEGLKDFGLREQAMTDIVEAYLRLGDAYLSNKPSAPWDALREYTEALAISQAIPDSYSSDEPRSRAAAKYGIGLALAQLGSGDEAELWLNEAMQVQDELVHKSPDDKSLKWDLAGTYMELGNLKAKKNAPSAAYDQYKKALALREEVVQDPGSLRRSRQLARDYEKVVGIIEALNKDLNLAKDDDARTFFHNQFDNLKELAKRDGADDEWLAKLGRSAKRRGELANRPEWQLKMYRQALDAWRELAARPKGAELLRGYYGDNVQIADAFAKAQDWPNAATAYGAAANIARINLADDPSNADWRARAEQAEASAETIKARGLNSPPGAPSD